MSVDLSKLPRILEGHPTDPQSLIGVLQDIQKEKGYLPEEDLVFVASEVKVPLSRLF